MAGSPTTPSTPSKSLRADYRVSVASGSTVATAATAVSRQKPPRSLPRKLPHLLTVPSPSLTFPPLSLCRGRPLPAGSDLSATPPTLTMVFLQRGSIRTISNTAHRAMNNSARWPHHPGGLCPPDATTYPSRSSEGSRGMALRIWCTLSRTRTRIGSPNS